MKSILAVMITALVAVALLPGTTQAKPGNGKGNGQDRDEVVRYWTPDRVAKAKPREVSPDRTGGFSPSKGPAKPGSGGTTAVTGAHWTDQASAVFRTTGKVLFTMAEVDYVCSGAVAAEDSTTTSLILTAGHCVYDETSKAFATNWMFVPAYEDGGGVVTNPDGTHSFTCNTVQYGCWTAKALVTTSAWANGGGSLAGFNNDYAFAVVGGGGKPGEDLQLDGRVGANLISFTQPGPASVYAFGYPQAAPYTGQTLTYCAGTDVPDTWGGSTDLGLKCNMTGGSSGGPWFIGFNQGAGTGTLTSVNSFKYTSGPMSGYMFGPSLGAYALKTYEATKTATGNLTVAR